VSRWVALSYDPITAYAERLSLSAWRAELLQWLAGDILELGAGTGRNLTHYGPAVERLVLCEPDRHMRRRLQHRCARWSRTCEILSCEAEAIDACSESFDAVVATLLLCSVADVTQVLTEARRVLKPSGRLILIEHIAAPPGTGRRRWQDRFDPTWQRLAAGCHLTRDPRQSLSRLGFEPIRVRIDEMRGAPGFLRRTLVGTWARASSRS